jgi:predicted solute-binding protein
VDLHRVGNVAYLNAVPLTWKLEDKVTFATPSELAALLRQDALDAAVVSVTEVLLTDRYDLLDGLAIASKGAVKSVFLAHRPPLEAVREVFCDEASLTSANLLRVLLAERGLRPAFRPLRGYDGAPNLEAVLLIGDRAIEFARRPHTHRIWDLGAAWHEWTRLPFVFAGWALRRGAHTQSLRETLRSAGARGVAALPEIVTQRTDFDLAFRREYFRRHVYFELGAVEKRGLRRFMEGLRAHGIGPVFEPRFV